MSRVRNTQSHAQDELTRQQGKGKQAPGVLDNSRTAHAVLSNSKPLSSHSADQKLTHVDSAGKNRDTLKQSFKHHESPPEECSHQTRESPHSSSAFVPDALRRIQQSRWAINFILTAVSPFPSPHATFLALAWQALVRDLWTMSCGVLLL